MNIGSFAKLVEVEAQPIYSFPCVNPYRSFGPNNGRVPRRQGALFPFRPNPAKLFWPPMRFFFDDWISFINLNSASRIEGIVVDFWRFYLRYAVPSRLEIQKDCLWSWFRRMNHGRKAEIRIFQEIISLNSYSIVLGGKIPLFVWLNRTPVYFQSYIIGKFHPGITICNGNACQE